MGFPITTRSMDDNTAQAMWDETNLNLKGQRIMLRYIRVTFGNIIMIPSSSTITQEDEDEVIDCTVYPEVCPTLTHVMIED